MRRWVALLGLALLLVLPAAVLAQTTGRLPVVVTADKQEIVWGEEVSVSVSQFSISPEGEPIETALTYDPRMVVEELSADPEACEHIPLYQTVRCNWVVQAGAPRTFTVRFRLPNDDKLWGHMFGFQAVAHLGDRHFTWDQSDVWWVRVSPRRLPVFIPQVNP
jgi:hypothetical protein